MQSHLSLCWYVFVTPASRYESRSSMYVRAVIPRNWLRQFRLTLKHKVSLYFCGRVPWLYQYWPGGFKLFVVLCPGTPPEGSTGSGSGFKASQKTGQRLKVSSDRLGEAGNRTCDPWFTRHSFIPYTTAASQSYKCSS